MKELLRQRQRSAQTAGHLFWEAVKDIPVHRRRQAGTAVYERQEPHASFDSLFLKVIGTDWRCKLDSCQDEAAWMEAKTF